jgi:hypothetical protein
MRHWPAVQGSGSPVGLSMPCRHSDVMHSSPPKPPGENGDSDPATPSAVFFPSSPVTATTEFPQVLLPRACRVSAPETSGHPSGTLSLSEIPDTAVSLQPTLKRRVGPLGARYSAAMLPAMEAITTVVLVRPEAPQDAEGVAVMRREIEQDGAREGSLVGECLEAARARGLSAEETYVFIAYQALLRLEETHQRHIYLSDIAPFFESPSPPGVTARIAAHAEGLVRSAVDLALRAQRAAAEFMRTSVGCG